MKCGGEGQVVAGVAEVGQPLPNRSVHASRQRLHRHDRGAAVGRMQNVVNRRTEARLLCLVELFILLGMPKIYEQLETRNFEHLVFKTAYLMVFRNYLT